MSWHEQQTVYMCDPAHKEHVRPIAVANAQSEAVKARHREVEELKGDREKTRAALAAARDRLQAGLGRMTHTSASVLTSHTNPQTAWPITS